ncbi:unnamed protein product [Somion occarium]|uniref:Uncharacterized protein n=1 Tax=Somion occarium TaxID=3059160 RepID=A0ABP1DVP9_9APHY
MLSTSPTPPSGDPGAVGLSDPQYSSKRRQMLDLVNKLHSTGVQLDIDLPVIAVIGSQSAGKSSLIESISGITLPRASGTCTRVPTECRLTRSSEPWQCTVSLRFITDAGGQPLQQVKNENFGDTIFDKVEVEERLRRAQRAILNPTTNVRQFLEGADEDPFDRELSFSKNCVTLQISGPDVADLSFVDLPGLIASVGNGGSDSDIELVEDLVRSYIERPSCIILLTVACETDFENQGAHRLTKKYDREGKRTIGVLTKPDRIPAGEEDSWLRFIKNEYEALENGWFSVKQPDSRTLQAGITWEEARSSEREFFSLTSPWSSLEFSYQQHLGTSNLTGQLSDILSALIMKRLPELQDELQILLEKTQESLKTLPKPPSTDVLTEILHLIGDFSRDLAKHLEGTPDEDGLLQAIRPAHEAFKRAIRATAPNFKPFEKNKQSFTMSHMLGEETDVDTPSFLSNEEDPTSKESGPTNAIYIDEVMERAKRAITRELPDHYPFVVSKEYILSFVSHWEGPTRKLFTAVYQVLLSHVKALVVRHFGKYAHGGLQHHVTLLASEFVKDLSINTMDKLLWILDLEKRPRTLNAHYYADYRDKFLAHYRGSRRTDSEGTLISKLERYDHSSRSPKTTDFRERMQGVLAGLTEIGIAGVKAADLPKLLPSDPFEPALDIMATVRAYFQVAYKRYADLVPMAIDHELILALDRDRALETALLKGLGITGAEAYQKCKEFLQEAPNVVARREELQKKRDRLVTAQQELVDLWL